MSKYYALVILDGFCKYDGEKYALNGETFTLFNKRGDIVVSVTANKVRKLIEYDSKGKEVSNQDFPFGR